MSIDDKHNFSADRPIHNIEDDLLGRGAFAKDLADAISSWHGNDSLIIALHGEWGTGKTSLKNMALMELSKRRASKVIEFTPWEWAAQDKISSSFFNEISSSLRKPSSSKSEKEIAKLLRRYGRYLNTGELVTNSLSNALPYLFISVLPLGIGAATISNDKFRIISTALIGIIGIWAAFLKWGGEVFAKVSGSIELSIKDSEQSSDEMRKEIIKLLEHQDNPIVIVLDDLDRLTTDQIRMVIQLVKANANFPNVVYLLLFQRDIVEQKLTDGRQSGRDYLEKIIQVPFDIPAISATTVHSILFRKLSHMLNASGIPSERIDETYWGNVFYGSLYQYFDNLRSVYRFTSTLSFHFSLLKGRSRFEVNPTDLIAVECLRVFEL